MPENERTLSGCVPCSVISGNGDLVICLRSSQKIHATAGRLLVDFKTQWSSGSSSPIIFLERHAGTTQEHLPLCRLSGPIEDAISRAGSVVILEQDTAGKATAIYVADVARLS